MAFNQVMPLDTPKKIMLPKKIKEDSLPNTIIIKCFKDKVNNKKTNKKILKPLDLLQKREKKVKWDLQWVLGSCDSKILVGVTL